MGLKTIQKKERGFCGTETGFFWRTESSKLGLHPSVVRRWGGQGGGNRGVDSCVITFFRCALCLWPSSDLPVIRKQTMPPKSSMMVPWLSISTKPSVVTWNFMNVSSSRREGVMREGVVEKPPAHMNHGKTFKGWPCRDASWELVPFWYTWFPTDTFLSDGNEEANYVE